MVLPRISTLTEDSRARDVRREGSGDMIPESYDLRALRRSASGDNIDTEQVGGKCEPVSADQREGMAPWSLLLGEQRDQVGGPGGLATFEEHVLSESERARTADVPVDLAEILENNGDLSG